MVASANAWLAAWMRRSVHAVDDAAARPAQALQPLLVEVERVDQARPRRRRDGVRLDPQPTAFELTAQSDQKLVAAPIRRPMKLVEYRDVGVPPPCQQVVSKLPQHAPLRPSDRSTALANRPRA